MKEYIENYLDPDTQSISDLEAVRYGMTSSKPRQSRSLGRHYFHALYFVTSGSGSLHIENLTFELGSGDVFFIPADVPASYYASQTDPWSYSWCAFTGRRAEGFHYAFVNIAPEKYVVRGINTRHYADIISTSLDLVPGKISSYLSATSTLFKLLADFSVEVFSDDMPVDSNDLAARARSLLDKRYAKKIQVQQIARELGVHPYYLSRVFKERFGIAPKQYLMLRKFSKAADLLASTDIPIANISSSLGFEDQLSFSKSFRQHFHCSPTEYRKTHAVGSSQAEE